MPLRRSYNILSSYSALLLFADVCKSQVRLDLLNLPKLLPGVFCAHARRHNDIVTNSPVDWCDNALLVTSLKTIDYPQNLGCVAASACGVVHLESDLLRRVDDEDRADSEGYALLLNVIKVVLRDHVVEKGDFSVGVGDDWELHGSVLCLVDIVNPLVVRAQVIRALSDISPNGPQLCGVIDIQDLASARHERRTHP